jgi:hypothetical protein
MRDPENYRPPVDDGGGCVEAWETLSEIRSEGVSTDSRRSVLRKAATGLGMSVSGLAAVADRVEAAADDPDRDAVELTGDEARRVFGRAVRSREVRRLFRFFVREQGWRPRVGHSTVTETRSEDGEVVHAVVIPFWVPGPEHEQAYIAWSTHEAWETQGVHSVHFDRSGDGSHDHWRLTEFTVGEDGGVRSREEVVENFLGCDDVNMKCVLSIAASYAGMFAGCAACSAALALPACAACISAVLAWAGAILCDWCNN